MRDEEIRAMLPETPPEALVRWARMKLKNELGGEFISFRRESFTLYPEMKQTMCQEDWDMREKETKKRWGAVCSCSACGEDFEAGWARDTKWGVSGIVLTQGEDGQIYDGFTELEEPYSVAFAPEERLNCPNCLEEGQLLPKSALRWGRTYSVLALELRELGGLTALIYWRICRRINESCMSEYEAQPFEAIVLRDGKLLRFSHRIHGMYGNSGDRRQWERVKSFRDPEQIRYHDYGSVCSKKVGAILWPESARHSLAGTSGEKTGLSEYLEAGGENPAMYLRLWSSHPNVENIVKAGFGYAVATEIRRQVTQALESRGFAERVNLEWADLSQVRPHRMLGMSREELRQERQQRWSGDMLRQWRRYNLRVENFHPADYRAHLRELGRTNLDWLMESAEGTLGDLRLSRVMPYLRKQSECSAREGVGLLIDYRRMLFRGAAAEPGHEELWPPRLRTAHDRLSEQNKEDRQNQFQQGFDKALEKYGTLQWTDGELCMLLPKSAKELVAEGKTLRHCVGGYAESHAGGKLIFFVRRYRRPERSYYTLNIDMTGERPRRIQLHGYGNERHGENKQYRHKIPQKVLDFCERWEREILEPWWKEQQRKKKKKEAKAA